ncbi:MAG: extracellular solute-binding protein family 3 [Acidimicrobiaceae bacterium]|nr:extracellular solute-binding protein family 3 [Acidimicrobiaceae bacterium]
MAWGQFYGDIWYQWSGARPRWNRESLKELVQRISLFRRLILVAGVTSLLVASSGLAGAANVYARFNAADARLVPASLRGVTWQIATDASYPPDEWMSGTKMVGLDVSIMSAVAATLGVTFVENNITFSAIVAGIKSGKYQIGNSSFTDTKSLEKSVNFVDYFKAGEGVFALSGSAASFRSIADLCGLTLAVVADSPEQVTATGEVAKCPTNEPLSVLSFHTDAESEAAVLAGQAQEALVDSQAAGYLVSVSKGRLELVGKAHDVAPYGLATAKTSTGEGLAVALRAALRTLVANGTYREILRQWGVAQGDLPLSKMVINGAIF